MSVQQQLIDRKNLPESIHGMPQEEYDLLLEAFLSGIDYSQYGGRMGQMDQFDLDYDVLGRTCPIVCRKQLDDTAHNYILQICRNTRQ